ncbi:MAG TPA: 4Fe-4S binding protein [Steroidobacteraceae bacterium]|nr:4Fe-4S binding protein [Steroidobacteraceae bacterium]
MNSKPQPPSTASLRKIPKELRRYKFRPDPTHGRLQNLIARLKGDPQFLRRVVQIAFVLLSIWMGIEFFLFMRWGLSGGTEAFYPRPPGAEAFLPISGLLGLLHWQQGGELNQIHPAATVILVAIIAASLLVRKSFCSWLCPVGTLGDWLAAVGKRLFKRNFVMWKWLDYPLRLVKYVLLVYFVFMLATMGAAALDMFVHGAYNRMADVNMYQFFAHITPRALGIVAALAVASVLYHRFWCRYLCPYGALLGIAGLLSPLRVTRVKETCIDCELCTRVCPSNIAVHRIGARRAGAKVGQVWSDECTTCMRCVDECPVKETLVVRSRYWPLSLSAPVVAGVVVGVFATVTAVAMATGHWNNAMSPAEYLHWFRQMAVDAMPH